MMDRDRQHNADLISQPAGVPLHARVKAELEGIGPVCVPALPVQQHGQPIRLMQQHRLPALGCGLHLALLVNHRRKQRSAAQLWLQILPA